jgi:serine protease
MMRGAFAFVSITLVGCATGGDTETLSSTESETFEEFRDNTYRENFEGGVYIVNGDTPIVDDKALYEFWESQQQGALIINKRGTGDDRWTDQQKQSLTYCISNNFGSNKPAIVEAMKRATETIGWETMAAVNFTYVSAEDGNCTTSNPNVLFPVKQVSGQPYLARAFFPSSPDSVRDVLVDTSIFNSGWAASAVLGHELGHVLGFRHEHTRPEAGTCFEDNNWRPLSPYDNKSIMHYPQCNGGTNALSWSATDKSAVAAYYGAPGTNPGTPTGGTTKTDTKSATVGANESQSYPAYTVKPGTTFTVTMSGTGDPDLYVQWDAAPTTTSYACRPYLDGASEQCDVTVPATATTANVMVVGYAAATYRINVSWTAP